MYKDILCKLLDSLVEAVGDLPRMESQLFADWDGPVEELHVRKYKTSSHQLQLLCDTHFRTFVFSKFLQPVIPEDLVDSYKENIRELIEEHRIGVELRVQDFDPFIKLVNGEASYILASAPNLFVYETYW